MISSNHVTMALFLTIFSLMVYRAAAKKEVIENWWGLSAPFSPRVFAVDGQTGQDSPALLQQQLNAVNTNPAINQNMITPNELPHLVSAINVTQLSNRLPANNLYNPYIQQKESFQGVRKEVPTFQVPGQQQSYLSPRQISTGLNSYIRYNIPDEKNLAARPNDPLMMKDSSCNCNPMDMAAMVEPVKERFQSGLVGSATPDYNQQLQQNATTSKEAVTSTLPISSMATSVGNDQVVNYNRLVFALQRDPTNGLGCPIRGDLPCVPCLSQPDPNSPVWFRPSKNPATALRSGAIQVIAGVNNVTAQDTAEVQLRSSQFQNTFAGVANPYPLGSPMQNLQTAQRTALSDVNMSTQYQAVVNNTIPDNTISLTTFA